VKCAIYYTVFMIFGCSDMLRWKLLLKNRHEWGHLYSVDWYYDIIIYKIASVSGRLWMNIKKFPTGKWKLSCLSCWVHSDFSFRRLQPGAIAESNAERHIIFIPWQGNKMETMKRGNQKNIPQQWTQHRQSSKWAIVCHRPW
jgi:hypothetical protein